jgi:N-acetyl-anhydromuramyl-L-alanine amidase AmpD
MKVNWDEELILKFGNPPERDLIKVNEIVIHHTAGDGSWRGLKQWFTADSCERKEQFKKFIGFTHYYIDKNGDVNQPFFLNTWMYHSCSAKHDKETVGIELIHAKGAFTEAQYEALANLVELIYNSCPIDTIVSHDYNYMHYSGKSKGCPSAWFDWARLVNMLNAKGFNPEIKLYNGA